MAGESMGFACSKAKERNMLYLPLEKVSIWREFAFGGS